MTPRRPRPFRRPSLASRTALGFAITLGGSGTAVASTGSASGPVGATVVASCSLSATTLAFGPYSGVQLDSTSTVTVTCTATTPYNVGLSNGLYGRRMGGPAGSRLPYQLFRNPTRTQSWGTTIGTDTVVGTGNGSTQNLTVYGRITAGQFKNPGSYTDTVVVTVTY